MSHPDQVAILNGSFERVTLEQTVERVAEMVSSGKRGWLCTVNVAILMMMREMPELRDFVERSAICVADGQPLVWVSRLQRNPLPERVAGVELIDAIAERAAREGWGIYLLGAKNEVVQEVARRLRDGHPGLRLSGVGDGYFSDADAHERAQAVADSGADILFVAMGVPRQERFVSEYWERLGVKVAVPVGGSFDVLAGIRMRAPEWIQRIGFEWAFRMAQEPGRLWKRYLVTNTQFVYLLARQMLRR